MNKFVLASAGLILQAIAMFAFAKNSPEGHPYAAGGLVLLALYWAIEFAPEPKK